jgi:hypothetical protein
MTVIESDTQMSDMLTNLKTSDELIIIDECGNHIPYFIENSEKPVTTYKMHSNSHFFENKYNGKEIFIVNDDFHKNLPILLKQKKTYSLIAYISKNEDMQFLIETLYSNDIKHYYLAFY